MMHARRSALHILRRSDTIDYSTRSYRLPTHDDRVPVTPPSRIWLDAGELTSGMPELLVRLAEIDACDDGIPVAGRALR
jgi:hypothetical protein